MKQIPALISVPVLCTVLAVPLARGENSGQDWPGWRGPTRDGAVSGPAWPDDFEGLEPRWSVELGKGYPGPVVSASAVFVVETVDKETAAVRALDRRTGDEIWRTDWPATGSVPFFAAANGDWVRSTPAFDGETLFVGDMRENLLALDAESGRVRWQVDIAERFGTEPPAFGFASSPLIDGTALYLQAANSLIRLDARTGDTVWRALDRPGDMMSGGAFSSPVIAEIGGLRQLVVLTREALHGVELGSGTVLWKQEIPSFRGMHILTPVVYDDSVFTSPYRERSYLYSLKRGQAGFEVEQTWTNKATGYMSSPVVIEGHAYMHLGNGRAACIDLETGTTRWTSKSFGRYWSMVYRQDRILALDESGELHLLRANPDEFELLASTEVADTETWAHIAVSGGQVFVRDLNGITAFDWSSAGHAVSDPAPGNTVRPDRRLLPAGEPTRSRAD